MLTDGQEIAVSDHSHAIHKPFFVSEQRTFFPIMAWNRFLGDPDVLTAMKECGVTVAGFVEIEHLDMVHAAGLKAIVADGRLSEHDWRKIDETQVRRQVAEVIAEVADHPAVIGYCLKGEPHGEEFDGLAVAASEVQRLAPGAWPYVDLFPIYAKDRQLGAATYDEYLEAFIRTCRPPIITYDNYSLMERQDVRPAYWTNLEAVRNCTLRHGVPFWNIVLAAAHFHYREITAADARFQAFTTLAYGGRGLSYFTFVTPSIGNYRMGPIDQFGHRTATYDHLRHVNLQIGNLAPTLVKLRSDAVYHFNDVPEGASGPDEQSLITEVGEGQILAGDFTHEDGSRYVMIVNTSFRDSTWCLPKYRGDVRTVWLVSPYSGQLIPYAGEQRVLAPGQGTLLKLEFGAGTDEHHA